MVRTSVVIPAYNSAGHVQEALQSVFEQSIRDFEVIVVDDGSSDTTPDILLPYARSGKLRYFRQKNGGPAAARNTGIRHARGRYIAFLDADDLWDRDKLKKSLSFLEEHGFDWTCTAMTKVRKNGERFDKRIPADSWALMPGRPEMRLLANGLFFFSSLPVNAQTVVARRECFTKAGLFDESFRIGEDTDLWLRFEEAGLSGGYLDEPLTVYRYNAASITRNRTIDGMREHLRVARKHMRILGRSKPLVRASYARFLWQVADVYYSYRAYTKAFRCITASIWFDHSYLWRGIARVFRIKPSAGKAKPPQERQITVLYYDPTSGFGGSSRCLVAWLNKLDRSKFKPLVAAHYDGPMIQKVRSMGIPVLLLPYRSFFLYNDNYAHLPKPLSYALAAVDFLIYDLPSAAALYRILRREQASVVHLNSKITSAVAGIIASKAAGVPSILHLHDTKVLVRRERLFARWVDSFVALTPRGLDLYRRELPGRRIELIPNGIDLAAYAVKADTGGIRAGLGIGRHMKVVGMVGRIVEGKGFADFVKAARLLRDRRDDVTFIIVGGDPMHEGEYEKYLRSLVAELGLEKDVVFTGWREDAIAVMAVFDVLVQASSTFPEGFGLTVVEAMAMGKPAVVTDIPGPSEVLEPGVTGLVVPPANPARMAEAIERIIANRRVARKMGKKGLERVKAHYDLEAVVRKIESSYYSVRPL